MTFNKNKMFQNEEITLEEWFSYKLYFVMKQTSAEFSSQVFKYRSCI